VPALPLVRFSRPLAEPRRTCLHATGSPRFLPSGAGYRGQGVGICPPRQRYRVMEIAGYVGDRRRPVTGGAVRGSSPRRRASVRRTRRKLPPRNGEIPWVNLGRLRRVTLATHPSRLLEPALAVHGQGRQARRAGGAPLMIVKKILTTSVWRPPDRR
jgi:hypothetical protein